MPRLTPDYPGGRKPPRWMYLRSFLPVLALILLFSFFLSSYSLLSHFRSPAGKQQIGWQAWDVVELKTASGGSKTNGTGTGEELDTVGGSTGNGTEFVPSIPLDNWDPLALHTTGSVKPCYFPPYLFPSYCAPETTPELDKSKGKWVIVEKDLNLRTGLWYLNVYYRRTRRLDADLITGIRVVPEPPSAEALLDLNGWIKADGDVRSGVWPSQPEARLWYKTRVQTWDDWWKRQPSAKEKRQDDDLDWGIGDVINDIITEVDVVYGDDAPFYGFDRIQGGKVLEAKAGKWESVDIAVRTGNPIAPRATTPTFHNDGTLKIMQIADLHYSVGNGECRDSDKQPCVGDPDTATWLGEALDAEKPDLVVFSGDQLNGQGTSYDSRSVLAKFAKPVIDRQIPWTVVFGNHDSEIAEDRDYQMRTIQNMPYSLAQAGPKAVDGVGNCESAMCRLSLPADRRITDYLKLHSSDASNMHIFTLYFLDAHAYQKTTIPWAKADYDYIKTSQIDWYRNVSATIKPIQRPFKPDGVDDLGHIWHRRSSPSRLPRADTTLARPNAMMWFHIPLPEAYAEADTAGYDGDMLNVGQQMDGAGNSKHNSGFFYNAIKEAFETDTSGEVEWFGEARTAEVKVLSHGHCHNTDRCRRVDGIWMCFDGGSSYSGYGQLGFDRRVRIYQISEYGEKVETYKRLTTGEIVDNQVLVGSGAADGVGKDQVSYR